MEIFLPMNSSWEVLFGVGDNWKKNLSNLNVIKKGMWQSMPGAHEWKTEVAVMHIYRLGILSGLKFFICNIKRSISQNLSESYIYLR